MSGHLFLVHGRTESLVHDAAVVPTDDDFAIEPTWQALIGAHGAALKPPGWPRRGYGRAAGGRPVWFVSVDGLATDDLVQRAVATVRDMAEADLSPSRNRVKRLLALPVLGIEGGGHNHDRGAVIRALLEALLDAVDELDVDIAVVTPERSVYAAAQHLRGEPRPPVLDDELLGEARRLGELARTGDLALFLGAGVSVPAGLPGWRQMLDELAQQAGIDPGVLVGLGPLDQAQLLQHRLPDLGEYVARAAQDPRLRPSLGHALVAGLGCREAVTTNYDHLYETAVAATGRGEPKVLPWETAVGASAWVLKLHGDVSQPATVTLTRRDFVRFDAQTGPAGALLQALLLTRHLLVVGASLNDDNVVRLLREVEVFRESTGLEGPMAAFLDVDDDRARRELWREQLAWSNMPGDDLPSRARALEIFLDTLAWYAAGTSWLLDPRFSELLGPEEREAAETGRALRGRLDGLGEEWEQLRATLDAAGACEQRGD